MHAPTPKYQRLLQLAAVACLAVAVTGCVSSTDPILRDGRAILGERGQVHLYEVGDGAARNPKVHAFAWAGGQYVVQGAAAEISAFTVHAYEGRELIVQARARRPLRPYVYALARKLAEGVYFMSPIDPSHADEAARNRHCVKTRDTPCRIETPEQLFVFARATAAREADEGRLAVLVRSGRR